MRCDKAKRCLHVGELPGYSMSESTCWPLQQCAVTRRDHRRTLVMKKTSVSVTAWRVNKVWMKVQRYLGEQVFHLGLFGPEAFDLLVDPRILLQLLQSGPFTVKVGTETKRTNTACVKLFQDQSNPDLRDVNSPHIQKLLLKTSRQDTSDTTQKKNQSMAPSCFQTNLITRVWRGER